MAGWFEITGASYQEPAGQRVFGPIKVIDSQVVAERSKCRSGQDGGRDPRGRALPDPR